MKCCMVERRVMAFVTSKNCTKMTSGRFIKFQWLRPFDNYTFDFLSKSPLSSNVSRNDLGDLNDVKTSFLSYENHELRIIQRR